MVLSLAIGERTDSTIIRKGAEKGVVEAVFDLDQQDLIALLKEGGIDHENGQDLIIRRELSISGKSRIFINNQAAQLSFLRKMGPHLAQIVSQHANQSLYSIDYHRQTVNLFGANITITPSLSTKHQQENLLRNQSEDLVKQESQRSREIDICRCELEELEESD